MTWLESAEHEHQMNQLSCKNLSLYYATDEYDPVESFMYAKGDKPPERPTIKPTRKRPFILPDLVASPEKKKDGWFYDDNRSAVTASYYKLLGCSIFDGLCIWQDSPDEIDCRECIRATFEAFLKGCRHREVYIDPYGTVRCAACKVEVDQIEQDEPWEDDSPLEADDFAEADDGDIILNDPRSANYRSWNMEGQNRQIKKNDPVKRILEVEREGHQARENGLPVTSNPYRKNGKWYERRGWHMGWHRTSLYRNI